MTVSNNRTTPSTWKEGRLGALRGASWAGLGTVAGSNPIQQVGLGGCLLHHHHIMAHTRELGWVGWRPRGGRGRGPHTPGWPGSSARGAGGRGSGRAEPGGSRRLLRARRSRGRQRSPHALSRPPAGVRDAPLPRSHAGPRVGEPRARAPAPSRAPGATLTSDARRRRLQRESAAGEHRARPAVRGPRRVAELSLRRLLGREASTVGPRSCSGRAWTGPAGPRPCPLPRPRSRPGPAPSLPRPRPPASSAPPPLPPCFSARRV